MTGRPVRPREPGHDVFEDELEHDPAADHALRWRLTGLRSYRVGAYRIIYGLRDTSTVRVVAIRYRGQAYETDPR